MINVVVDVLEESKIVLAFVPLAFGIIVFSTEASFSCTFPRSRGTCLPCNLPNLAQTLWLNYEDCISHQNSQVNSFNLKTTISWITVLCALGPLDGNYFMLNLSSSDLSTFLTTLEFEYSLPNVKVLLVKSQNLM